MKEQVRERASVLRSFAIDKHVQEDKNMRSNVFLFKQELCKLNNKS